MFGKSGIGEERRVVLERRLAAMVFTDIVGYTRMAQADEAPPHEPLAMVNQGLLYALTGRRIEAQAMLEEIAQESNEAVRNYGRLFISAALGNFDDAFNALDRAADMHAWPFLIGPLPIFSELRRGPRYAGFAKRVGLPAPSSA